MELTKLIQIALVLLVVLAAIVTFCKRSGSTSVECDVSRTCRHLQDLFIDSTVRQVILIDSNQSMSYVGVNGGGFNNYYRLTRSEFEAQSKRVKKNLDRPIIEILRSSLNPRDWYVA
jgi:hypothetical protein